MRIQVNARNRGYEFDTLPGERVSEVEVRHRQFWVERQRVGRIRNREIVIALEVT